MLTDARTVEREARLQFDVCIVGGGAAGIVLARELAAGGRLRVGLLESGGFEDAPEQRDLCRGESVGRAYFELETCRLRFFGGTTNHWSGYSRPLDPIDFEQRSWVPGSGWPLTRSDLEPYYRRAHPLLELGPFRYDAAFWQRTIDAEVWPFDPELLRSVVFQMSPPTRFGTHYRDDLVDAENVELVLHANVVGIDTDETGREVTGVRVRTLEGGAFGVRARVYVLAAGGIENPRILLLSRSASHPTGLGNRHDLVGRYFMEHPHLVRAILMPRSLEEKAAYYHSFVTAQGNFLGAFRFRSRALRRERLNNLLLTLADARRIDEELAAGLNSPGAVAYENLARHLERGEWPDDWAENVWQAIKGLDDVALTQTPLRRGHQVEGAMYRVLFRSEQTPNHDSRVTLGDATDAFGQRRVRLDWRLTEQDLWSLRRGHELLAQEVGRAGIGRLFSPGPEAGTGWLEDSIGACHHMGTTRMHEEPEHGVVDASCRLHGVANFYVAGSSVFPTSGCSNPTLTLVALALRLGDELRERLL